MQRKSISYKVYAIIKIRSLKSTMPYRNKKIKLLRRENYFPTIYKPSLYQYYRQCLFHCHHGIYIFQPKMLLYTCSLLHNFLTCHGIRSFSKDQTTQQTTSNNIQSDHSPDAVKSPNIPPSPTLRSTHPHVIVTRVIHTLLLMLTPPK